MAPARQRLPAGDEPRHGVDDGLVGDADVAALEREGEGGAQLEATHRALMHRRGEELDLRGSASLGRVKRGLGAAQEVLARGSGRREGDAEAGGQRDVGAVEPDGLGERIEQPARLALGDLGVADALEQQRELVAGDAREPAALGDAAAQPLGDGGDQAVAGDVGRASR